MKKIFISLFLLLPLGAFADTGLITGTLFMPYHFDYPGDVTESPSARKVFLFPAIGADINGYISIFNSGLYWGGGVLGLKDLDQGFGGNKSTVAWTGYYASARFYLGNLLLKKSASGLWGGANVGKGDLVIDYDGGTPDATHKGDMLSFNGGFDFAFDNIRVGPYYNFHTLKADGQSYRARSVGLQAGVSF